MRGHGRSTNPSGKFSHPQSAEDIRALMDSLNIKPARAIGFSSGAMTLLRLATNIPTACRNVLVVAGTTGSAIAYLMACRSEQVRKIIRGIALAKRC